MRAAKRAWLTERDYTVLEVKAADVEADPGAVLDRLAVTLVATQSTIDKLK